MNDTNFNIGKGLIRDIHDTEIYLVLKKICQYIVDEAWHTSGDLELDYAIGKTRQYEDDIQKIAALNVEIGL